MLKKIIITVSLIVLAAGSVFADQAAWITKAEAQTAAAFLKDKPEIVNYCEPCDDKSKTLEAITSVDAAPTGTEDYWEVRVNGAGIDLAYVYFKQKDGKWKNLAMEMDIKVKDVPKFIQLDGK